MKSILPFTLAAATLLSTSLVGAAQTDEGCFTSSTGLTYNGTNIFNSRGACGTACTALGSYVFAMTNSTCWCGDELPPAADKTATSDCTATCPGYPSDICGGINLWSVWLTGLSNSVPNAGAGSSSSSAGTTPSSASSTATTSSNPSTVTVGGQTVVVTAGASSSTGTAGSSTSSSSSSPSKAGIAIGVVVGLLAISVIAGGAFLFVRNRRRREVEEEYRRNAAVSSFIAGGAKPGSSAGASFTDTRLDPAVMAHRRMSDGSIADNQDYSRRILKVTNA